MRARRHDGRKRLYLDFDGYFAAVEEQVAPALHGRPVAVLPYEGARTCVISSNAAAKRHGVGTGTGVDEARRRCPGIALVGQRPDLYVRVQRRIAHAVNAELPIDAVCSVDELCCVLGARDGAEDVGRRIKARLREAVGPRVTCSMGVASNRWLAKVASAIDKPDGLTVLDALPGRLLELDLEDLPGVGARVRARLHRAGIETVAALWEARPRALRSVWGTCTGSGCGTPCTATTWGRYARGGGPSAMDGCCPRRRGARPARDGRWNGQGGLPPEARCTASARPWVRLLVVKAARRLRREGWTAGRLCLAVERIGAPLWQGAVALDRVDDDRSCLAALGGLWAALATDDEGAALLRVQVWLDRLEAVEGRQGELLARSGPEREKARALSEAVDALNARYGRTVIGFGRCGDPSSPAAGYAGAKIAYGRIPELEDFR